jgi:hypothetical protein
MDYHSIAGFRSAYLSGRKEDSKVQPVIEFDVVIKKVDGTRLSEEVTPDTNVVFYANADISEGERSPGKLTLKFGIDLTATPEVAKLSVAGTAVIRGEDQEIEQLLKPKEEESAPPVFMKIYQKVYSVMYLVSGSLQIPYPSPGLLSGVHMATKKQMKQVASARIPDRTQER